MLLLSPLLGLRICVCVELSSNFSPLFFFFLAFAFPSPFSSHTSAELTAHLSLREALGNNTGSTGYVFLEWYFLEPCPKWRGGEEESCLNPAARSPGAQGASPDGSESPAALQDIGSGKWHPWALRTS